MTPSSTPRIMALDLGEKRIGVALSDPSRMIAAGYGAIKRTSRQSDFRKLGNIAKENNVDLIIVGLPVPLSGQEGTRAAWARDYAASLSSTLGIPFRLWDEALTTVDAEASLRARGYNAKRRREIVDSVAAAFILQSYLDSVLDEDPSQKYDEI